MSKQNLNFDKARVQKNHMSSLVSERGIAGELRALSVVFLDITFRVSIDLVKRTTDARENMVPETQNVCLRPISRSMYPAGLISSLSCATVTVDMGFRE